LDARRRLRPSRLARFFRRWIARCAAHFKIHAYIHIHLHRKIYMYIDAHIYVNIFIGRSAPPPSVLIPLFHLVTGRKVRLLYSMCIYYTKWIFTCIARYINILYVWIFIGRSALPPSVSIRSFHSAIDRKVRRSLYIHAYIRIHLHRKIYMYIDAHI